MNALVDTTGPQVDPRLSLRPTISISKTAKTPAEKFQNETLRPIIKMQNELILPLYKHFLTKRKVKFNEISLEARRKWIEQSMTKDHRLRSLLLGMVIGQFTETELAGFIKMEGEIRKRIINLITQRLQTQMKALL